MQLVIAEKPSVARDLARVLGVRASGEHCFEGERCVITWCIGHLVELDEPASYNAQWRAWRIENLPMLPSEFRLRGAKHAKAQLRAVSSLLRDRRFRGVVNACDAGREGELIFRYVYQYAGAALPIQRLWVSSLTDEAIRRGFAQLRPGAQLEPLADAARSRSEADWLVGMNATRAFTARGREAGHDLLYSIGRVQTPTLAMLVARERAIRQFVPRSYWEVRGRFDDAFTAQWRLGSDSRLATSSLAEAIVTRDKPAPAVVERVRARTTREAPPLLFDLTSLQRTANKRFGFSAARTLEIAQALYERHKVLTYPRTDSRHLSTDVVTELPQVFGALAQLPEYSPFASVLLSNPPTPSRRIVDDTKVGDHHAIIPTSKPARSLDRDESRIYDLVVRRFLGAFYPDAEFAITEAWIRVGPPSLESPTPKFPDEARPTSTPTDAPREPNILETLPPMPDRYFARGRVRTVAGWQEVAGIGATTGAGIAGRDAGGRDSSDEALLPPLVEGQQLRGAYSHVAKQTTPPPRYTEATLLGAMESAGKSIDDEALRAAMKDRGLGTPATRAAIIETLLRRSYIIRNRQDLTPTPLGINLIESLISTPASPIATLASPELTGTWEARLARIARGEESRSAFMADIARYVAGAVAAIRSSAPPAAPPPGSAPQQQSSSGRWGKRGGGGGRGRANYRGRGGGWSSRAPKSTSDGASTTRAPSSSSNGSSGAPTWAPNRNGESTYRGGDSTTRGTSSSSSSSNGPSSSSNGLSGAPTWAPNGNGASRYRGDDSTTRGASTSSNGRSARPVSESVPKIKPARATRSNAPVSRVKTDGSRAKAVGSRVKAVGSSTPTAPTGSPTELACPQCKQGNLIVGARGWGCGRWREGCRFVVWFETAGRRVTAAQLRDLVTRGKTRKATFEPSRGTPVAGRLVLDASPNGCNVRFEPS